MEQSPLSHSIKTLEEELGVRLLHRTSRRTWLTPAGETFLRDARRLLSEARSMVSALTQATLQHGLVIRVGLAEHAASEQFTRFLFEMEHHQPTIRVEPKDLSTSEIVQDLLDGRLDLGFIGEERRAPGLISRPIWRAPIRLITSLRHPAAERDAVSIRIVRGETLISPDPATWPGLARQFDHFLARHGIVPARRQEVKNLSTAASMVAAERGVSLVYEPFSWGLTSVAVLPIEERDSFGQFWVIHRSDYSTPDTAPVIAVLDAIAAEEGVAALD